MDLESILKKLDPIVFCTRPLYLACPTCSNKQYCISVSVTWGSHSSPRRAFSLNSWEATITRQSPHLSGKIKCLISRHHAKRKSIPFKGTYLISGNSNHHKKLQKVWVPLIHCKLSKHYMQYSINENTLLKKKEVQVTVSIFFPTFWQLKIKQVIINSSLSVNLWSNRKLKLFKLSLIFSQYANFA